jgi:hypothetical protein
MDVERHDKERHDGLAARRSAELQSSGLLWASIFKGPPATVAQLHAVSGIQGINATMPLPEGVRAFFVRAVEKLCTADVQWRLEQASKTLESRQAETRKIAGERLGALKAIEGAIELKVETLREMEAGATTVDEALVRVIKNPSRLSDVLGKVNLKDMVGILAGLTPGERSIVRQALGPADRQWEHSFNLWFQEYAQRWTEHEVTKMKSEILRNVSRF